jgi:DNA repair exonuclease SbcCD ATPase subunit
MVDWDWTWDPGENRLTELEQDKAMLQGALEAATEQNDRLRAQLALMVDPEIGRLRGEVKRLRAEMRYDLPPKEYLVAEVKRLRAAGAKEAAEHVTHCMQMENEVERTPAHIADDDQCWDARKAAGNLGAHAPQCYCYEAP